MFKILIFLFLFVGYFHQTFAENLRRTKYSLYEQNHQADKEQLPRLTEADLALFKENGWLIRLPNDGIRVIVDQYLSEKYQWSAKQAHLFLLDSGEKFILSIGKPVIVTSAVRTFESQKHLRKSNRNAASADGPERSSHLTGATIDIAKRGLNKKQLVWVRSYLSSLMKRGLIHVTEEFHQAVFHIMVYKEYIDSRNDAIVAQN